MNTFAEKIPCYKYSNSSWEQVSVAVPKEVALEIFINNSKLVTILSTPFKIKPLVIGFLYSERIITDISDIEEFSINNENFTINIKLKNNNFKKPENQILTSGFGKGTIFNNKGIKVNTTFKIKSNKIIELNREFINKMELYKISGAVHASCLADENKVIIVTEDIGRHNTFDKIQGECLLNNIETKDKIVITTGRISSEMLLKASKMQIPVVASMKSPTGNSVALAEKLNISLIGHLKDNSFVLYTLKERVN